MTTTGLATPPGLKGVPVVETEIGAVRGGVGYYHYRHYSAPDLARTTDLEDVWRLLVDGELPNAAERRSFRAEVRGLRQLPPGTVAALGGLPQTIDPLDGLRALLSVFKGEIGARPLLDLDESARRRDALAVAAIVPTMVAALWRHRGGLPLVDPDPELGHGANYLLMVNGEPPTAEQAAALETYLDLTVDHGLNASTFTSRVIASTGADTVSAVVGAIGALSGPLHGGAPSRVLAMLDDIGAPDRAEAWVQDRLGRHDRIMGFGHAVYRTDDPRSVLLREVALRLGGQRAERAVAIEPVILGALRRAKPDRVLATNVEYYAAVVLEGCGLPPELFTPTFTVSRVIGWSAHILEQAANGVLFRPAAAYIGPEPAA